MKLGQRILSGIEKLHLRMLSYIEFQTFGCQNIDTFISWGVVGVCEKTSDHLKRK